LKIGESRPRTRRSQTRQRVQGLGQSLRTDIFSGLKKIKTDFRTRFEMEDYKLDKLPPLPSPMKRQNKSIVLLQMFSRIFSCIFESFSNTETCSFSSSSSSCQLYRLLQFRLLLSLWSLGPVQAATRVCKLRRSLPPGLTIS
jgi:hypothetical protein